MPQGRKKFDEREKQAVLERLWLTYYNDTLFSRGLITEEQRNKMRILINNRQAASGDSARKIAMDLNNDGVIPPLKYRVLKNGEKFSEGGAARASDLWNHTTVKRILKNRVCLGNTYLFSNINCRTGSLKASRPILMFRLYLRNAYGRLNEKPNFKCMPGNIT